jgi:hypothetical protein
VDKFYLTHWIAVFSVLGFMAVTWGYPLSILCRRAGKPAAIGWLAGTLGVLVLGPMLCVWWLAYSTWKPSPAQS